MSWRCWPGPRVSAGALTPPASYPAAFDDYRRVEAPSIDAVNTIIKMAVDYGVALGLPHLHLELRVAPGLELGGGYGRPFGQVAPSPFIRAHRPRR